MKKAKLITSILLFSFSLSFQITLARQSTSVRQEVLRKINKLKPPNEKDYVYRVAVPLKLKTLPDNLRLDVVYKIGHYEFSYVSLRFERKTNEPFVDITKFSYGSALGFYKPYAKGDSFVAKQGKIPVKDFNRLLTLAYTFYKSDIEKINLKPGFGSYSSSSSSGDGRIILNLSNSENVFQPIVKESGTLHAGKLKNRISNGYSDLRVHLFWEVFYDYLEKNNIFSDLKKSQAEEIAISRLEEPQMIDNYTDYYRQSNYVEVLGEIGTSKSLPILNKLAKSNSLEKDWDKYLSENALKAVEKIKAREQRSTKPTF